MKQTRYNPDYVNPLITYKEYMEIWNRYSKFTLTGASFLKLLHWEENARQELL